MCDPKNALFTSESLKESANSKWKFLNGIGVYKRILNKAANQVLDAAVNRTVYLSPVNTDELSFTQQWYIKDGSIFNMKFSLYLTETWDGKIILDGRDDDSKSQIWFID
jgi:hypothetical protein